MSRQFFEVARLRQMAVMALAVGVAVGLSGCLGGGGSGGAPNSTPPATILNATGWGIEFGSNVSATVTGPKTARAEFDANDNMTKVTLGQKTFTCQPPLSQDACKTAAGGSIELEDLSSIGYQYLGVLGWEQNTNAADPTPGDLLLVGGKTSDRTQNMPTSGTATYKGNVGASVVTSNTRTIFGGDVTLQADFGKGTVSGTLGNFREDGTGNPIAGTVSLQNGKISGNTMSASLTGRVAGHDIDTANTRMNGGFFGPQAQEVGGGIAGRTNLGAKFSGIWWAKKQ